MTIKEKEAGGLVLGVLFALALAIIISRQLLPIFLGLSILTIIILIIIIIIELINNSFGKFSLYVAGAFVIFFLLTSVTWFIGYGIGRTSFCQASLEVYYAITGAEQQVDQALQDSINQIVNESCKTLNKQSFNALKTYAQSAKIIQEVQNKANELKKLSNLVKKIKRTAR